MRKTTFLLLVAGLTFLTTNAQIAFQGFGGTGADTWSYTAFPTFYENQTAADDDWFITGSMPNIVATDGNFVGGGDTDNDANPPGFSYLDFGAVNIGGVAVDISFDYHLYNYDNGDVVEFEIAYDNGSDWSSPDQTISILNNAQNSPGNSGWLNSSTTVPGGNTYVRARFTLQQNGADQIGIDNFKIETASVLSTSENKLIEGLSYGPNPTKNTVNLKANSVIEKVTVFNLVGKQVFEKNGNTKNMAIYIENQPKGIYYVKIFSKGKTDIISVLKK